MASVELKKVSVSVEDKPIVSDVTCAFHSGQIVVLMGSNGSGKSTLVNAMAGHPKYRIISGEFILDGEDVTTLSPDQKAKRGFFFSPQHVPQIGGVTLATFLHAVHVGITGETIDVLEYYLTLRELVKKLDIPESLLDRPLATELSGGEKKISEMIQLAALKPRFAVLDEPDSGVDVDALRKVFSTIEYVRAQGAGLLIISHHPSLLTHINPDLVFVMAGGRFVKQGGRELADTVLRDGFCKGIECPFEENCDVKNRA